MLPQGFFMVNIWGVLIAAVVSILLGMLWYGPLFGKKWMSLVGMTPEIMASAKNAAYKSYIISALINFLMAYVIGIFIKNMFVPDLRSAFLVGFLAWLGFVATTMATQFLYSVKKDSWTLYAINVSYQLVSILLASIILFIFINLRS